MTQHDMLYVKEHLPYYGEGVGNSACSLRVGSDFHCKSPGRWEVISTNIWETTDVLSGWIIFCPTHLQSLELTSSYRHRNGGIVPGLPF